MKCHERINLNGQDARFNVDRMDEDRRSLMNGNVEFQI